MKFAVGTVIEGVVNGMTGFGAFVDIGSGKSGLVHISEISNQYVEKVSDHLKEGQKIKVKIVGIDPNGKIALSIKKALEPEKTEIKQKVKSANTQKNIPKTPLPPLTFEDKMLKFKQDSEEKIQALKKNKDGKRSRGSRRI